MEVHLENKHIKSIKAKDQVRNLREMYMLMRRYNIKLNTNKFAFRVEFESS